MANLRTLSDLLNDPAYLPANNPVPVLRKIEKNEDQSYKVEDSALLQVDKKPILNAATTKRASGEFQRFLFENGKPSDEQWRGMLAFFKLNPHLRIPRSTKHPTEPNKYFLSYHRDYAGGERWVTKQQLSDARKAARSAQKRWRKVEMKRNPDYKEKRLSALKEFAEKRDALVAERREALGKPKRRRAGKSQMAKGEKALERRKAKSLERLAVRKAEKEARYRVAADSLPPQ